MTAKNEQLPFDLAPRLAHEREDFWVSESNSAAVGWIDKWATSGWPAPALIIFGPPASGKTHLLQVWKKEAKAKELTTAQLTPDTISRALGEAKTVIIDNVSTVAGIRVAEEALLHLYNMLRERGGSLLMTAATSPAEWPLVLPDLKSRLMAAPAVEVGSPDDALMAVVLTKLFSDRQIFVPQEVIQFMLTRIERSFLAMRQVVDRIDRQALSEKRPVTIPLVRDLL
jgi:DnaA regulatory inactivator Hda